MIPQHVIPLDVMCVSRCHDEKVIIMEDVTYLVLRASRRVGLQIQMGRQMRMTRVRLRYQQEHSYQRPEGRRKNLKLLVQLSSSLRRRSS